MKEVEEDIAKCTEAKSEVREKMRLITSLKSRIESTDAHVMVRSVSGRTTFWPCCYGRRRTDALFVLRCTVATTEGAATKIRKPDAFEESRGSSVGSDGSCAYIRLIAARNHVEVLKIIRGYKNCTRRVE